MIGYKVFNSDFTCRGIKFEVGKTYKHDGKLIMCESGFHFCEKLVDCFNYYQFSPKNKVCKVVALGNVDCKEEGDSKFVTDEIYIEEELNWYQVLELCNTGYSNTGYRNTGYSNTGYRNTGHRNTGDSNTGHRNTGHRNTGDSNTGHRNTGDSNTGHRNTGDGNTGDWNTGDSNTGHRNTGHRNTGHRNTGHRNTGHRNTGDWNTVNYSSGYFNTIQQDMIMIFNKPCLRSEWVNSIKPNFLYFHLTTWIYKEDMTQEEKDNYPEYKTLGGYLKELEYKEAFQESFSKASQREIEQLKKLPNFDADVFFEISGIRIK
jgi:hypothetical protein